MSYLAQNGQQQNSSNDTKNDIFSMQLGSASSTPMMNQNFWTSIGTEGGMGGNLARGPPNQS